MKLRDHHFRTWREQKSSFAAIIWELFLVSALLTTIGSCIWLPIKMLAVSSTVHACGGEGAGLAGRLPGETVSSEAGIQQES